MVASVLEQTLSKQQSTLCSTAHHRKATSLRDALMALNYAHFADGESWEWESWRIPGMGARRPSPAPVGMLTNPQAPAGRGFHQRGVSLSSVVPPYAILLDLKSITLVEVYSLIPSVPRTAESSQLVCILGDLYLERSPTRFILLALQAKGCSAWLC